jgi:hypothetical protein
MGLCAALCCAVLCHAVLSAVAFNLGLVDDAVQIEISQQTEEVLTLMGQGSWEAVSHNRVH